MSEINAHDNNPRISPKGRFRNLWDTLFLPKEQKSDPQKQMNAKMIYDLVPKLFIQGVFETSEKVMKQIKERDGKTGLEKKILLARAIEDVHKKNGYIHYRCTRMGKVAPFSTLTTEVIGNRTKATIVINEDHRALKFNRRLGYPVDMDQEAGLNLILTFADAGSLLETTPADDIIPRSETPASFETQTV